VEDSIGAVEETTGAVEDSTGAMVEPSDRTYSSDSTNPALRCCRCLVIHDPLAPIQYFAAHILNYVFIVLCCAAKIEWDCVYCFWLAVRVLKRAKSNTIVLTGLTGSGKTVLYYQVSVSIVGFIP
jgi:hypothetical protein